MRTKDTQPDNSAKEITNVEIVTLAVYLLGGEKAPVDVEDVAMKVNALAPGRFTWRKYPEQIHLKKVSTILFDARKPKCGAKVLGSDAQGWLLSPSGLEFASQFATRLQSLSQSGELSRRAQTPRERNWQRAENARLLDEAAYLKFRDGRKKEITHAEIESLFRLNDYVSGQARAKKIVRYLNAFADDVDLGPVLKALSERLSKVE